MDWFETMRYERLHRPRYYCPACGQVQRANKSPWTGDLVVEPHGISLSETGAFTETCNGGTIDPEEDRAP